LIKDYFAEPGAVAEESHGFNIIKESQMWFAFLEVIILTNYVIEFDGYMLSDIS